MRKHLCLALLALACFGVFVMIACGGKSSSGSSGGASSPAADDDNEPGASWTDPSSGLTWQVTPTGGALTWTDAQAHCQGLAGGGWRLPTISELRTLIVGCSGTQTGGGCGVTDNCRDSTCANDSCIGTACGTGDGPDNGCYGPAQLADGCDYFWSASAVADVAGDAWSVYFANGHVSYLNDDYTYFSFARCVQ